MFSACQPKDKAVITPREREQILDLQKAKNQAKSGLIKLGSFGASAFLVDQQAESLNWIMYLLNAAYIDNGYSATTDKDKNFPILQNNGSRKSSPNGIYHILGEFEVNIRKLEQDVFDKMSVNGHEVIKFQSELLQIDSSVTDHRSVEIKPEGSEQFTIKIAKDGDLNLNKSGKIERVTYTLSSFMIVKVDLLHNIITVVKSITSMKISRSPELYFKIESENELKYQFNQQCITALGKVRIIDPRNNAKNKTLIIEEKSVRVEGTNWLYELAQCAERPIIDVYKLLKY